MNFDKGRLIDHITHLVPGRSDLLGALERGELDATLLDLRRLDAYRATHPDSSLAATGYYYPIGANRAYVGLASDPALIGAVNKALSELEANGTIEQFAKTSGLTYLKPREPIVLGDVMQQILQK
jgi:ABC-type amino acid transport substrate-binding protein